MNKNRPSGKEEKNIPQKGKSKQKYVFRSDWLV